MSAKCSSPWRLPPARRTGRELRTTSESDTPAEHALFERLRKLRKRLADQSGVPPYVIFHDYTLREMVRQAPTSIEEFASIPGVGPGQIGALWPDVHGRNPRRPESD